MSQSMYTITPSQAEKKLIRTASRGMVPYLEGSPGVGKSSIVKNIADTYNLKLIDLRLSQCTPEDLQGFPMRTGDKATFTPFDVFPVEGDKIPEGSAGWLLFCDEPSSATKPVQAAAYKLMLDRQVGSFKLHENCVIMAAGNKATDKAVVNKMSTALQSRLVHYELETNPKDWIQHAFEAGYDHRVIGFIQYMPSKLMAFNPDHTEKTFPCPRTWEFVSRLVKDDDITHELAADIAGAIGEGNAVEFIGFAKEYDNLPRVSEIEAEPMNVPVPPEASTKFATMSMLVEHTTKDNVDTLLDYIQRFDIEFQILYCRGVTVKFKELLQDRQSKFSKYVLQMTRYLHS